MADPANVLAVDDIAIMTGYEVRAGGRLARGHRARSSARLDRLDDVVREAVDEEPTRTTAEVVDLRESADDAPVIKLVNPIIAQAVERGASDIHFEPGGRRACACASASTACSRRSTTRAAADGRRASSPA